MSAFPKTEQKPSNKSEIIIHTNLKVIPKSCTKCKYSYLYEDCRFCSVLFKHGHNVPIDLEYVPAVNNYCYIKPKECPLEQKGAVK